MHGSKPADIPCRAQPPVLQRTFNLKQAAEYLGISRSHLLNIIKGKVKGVPPLQPIRVGRRLLFLRETLDRWLDEAQPKTAGTIAEQVWLRRGSRNVTMPPNTRKQRRRRRKGNDASKAFSAWLCP